MSMILKHITIQNLGSIDFLTHDFADGFNIVKRRYIDEISYAIQIVLNHKAISLPTFGARRGSKIEAIVSVEEKQYLLTATHDPKRENPRLQACDENGADVTREYLYLTSHCPEHDLADAFREAPEDCFFRVLQYADEDRYFRPKEFSKLTDGLSQIKAFRSYLRSFVKKFKSEPIREGKHYEFVLETNGRYGVRYKNEDNFPVVLSESEQTLFRYLCFLRTAEFWHGFEELRNLHSIKKPLLVEKFLERLDESIDIQDLVQRTMQLERQIIILSV